MKDFSYEPCCHQLCSFLIVAFLSWKNHRSHCFIGFEPSLTSIMCLANSWDTWLVGRLPSEDIFVVLKKVGERKFLFCREMGTNGCYFGGITSTQVDLPHVSFFCRSKDARLLG
jgi:hypothetical protein